MEFVFLVILWLEIVVFWLVFVLIIFKSMEVILLDIVFEMICLVLGIFL